MEDECLRQMVISLMNLGEQLSANVAQHSKDIQRLREKNHRLKGEQGTPTIKANTKAQASQSSGVSNAHHKASRRAQIRSDRVEVGQVDEAPVPTDAPWKGDEDVMVQDAVFHTETIRFRTEKEYSHRTPLADLPAGSPGRPVWSRSESLGMDSLRRIWQKRAHDPGSRADSRRVEQCRTTL